MIICLLIGLLFSPSASGWYNSGWRYRQNITIESNKVSGILTNFPVLITASNVYSNVWMHAQTNGQDIIFVKADDTTRLSHEIETYNTNTQQLAVWVKIPCLGADTGRVVRMYYGNLSAGNQQNATSVWDNGYNGVWHMQGSSETNYDSSPSNNHGTIQFPGCVDTGNVPISTCEATNGWSVSYGALMTTNLYLEGTSAVAWVVDASVLAGATNTITYHPAASMDLGNRNLNYWYYKLSSIKSTNFTSIKLWLYDTDGNYRCRDLTQSSTTVGSWFQQIYSINSGGTQSAVPPNYNAIDRVVWEFVSKYDNRPFTYMLDSVYADGGPDRNVTGNINGAAQFDGSNDWYRLNNVIRYPSNTTISAWFKLSQQYGGVILDGCAGNMAYPLSAGIDLGSATALATWNTPKPRFHLGYYIVGTATNAIWISGDVIADWSNWHFMAGISDDAGSYLYLDNVLIAQTNLTVAGAYQPQALLEDRTLIGGLTRFEYEGLYGAFPGIIDEIQCSAVARSTNWMTTLYINQVSPAAFATPSVEEPFPSGTIIKIR